jgi:hypothetical protein
LENLKPRASLPDFQGPPPRTLKTLKELPRDFEGMVKLLRGFKELLGTLNSLKTITLRD